MRCWEARFLTMSLYFFFSQELCALKGHSPLASSPLQQASRATQTRPGVQSICLDKCGDLGPQHAMQGWVLIVCVPSNSPQSPGLSSHSIHPSLCLVSNLNLTHWTREGGVLLIFFLPSFTITLCLLKDQFIVQAYDVIKYDFFFLNVWFCHSFSLFLSCEGVTVGGWMGSRWTRGGCLPYTSTPWSTISWGNTTSAQVAETIWESGWSQASPQGPLASTGPTRPLSALLACWSED